VENHDFFIPLTFDAPVRGSLSECCHNVCCGKARMVWLPECVSRVDRILMCDGQMDGYLVTA